MSLVSGALASDRVNAGRAAGISGATIWCFGLLTYITTLTGNRVFGSKINPGVRGWQCRLNGVGGNIELRTAAWGTTNMIYITNDTPFATLNTWYYVFGSVDTTLGSAQAHIYAGTVASLAGGASVTERAYGTATDGTTAGTYAADTNADDYMWFNTSGLAAALQGRGAWGFYHVGAIITAAQAAAWFRRPGTKAGSVSLSLVHALGYQGAGDQTDYSGNGNTGVVTGCTQNQNNPLVHGQLVGGLDPYRLAGERMVA